MQNTDIPSAYLSRLQNSDLEYQKHKLSYLFDIYVPDHMKLSPSGSSAQICKVSDYFVKTGKINMNKVTCVVVSEEYIKT